MESVADSAFRRRMACKEIQESARIYRQSRAPQAMLHKPEDADDGVLRKERRHSKSESSLDLRGQCRCADRTRYVRANEQASNERGILQSQREHQVERQLDQTVRPYG